MGVAKTNFVIIPDHGDRAVARLIRPYKGKPRIEALVRALAEGAQVKEEAAFDTLIGTLLDLAVDDALDQWGALVGEARLGLSNDDYRRFIRARILANVSESTADELIAIVQALTSPSEVQLRYNFPAGFQIWFIHDTAFSTGMVSRIRRFMLDVKPAGVALMLTEATASYKELADPITDTGKPFDAGQFARTIV